MSHDCSFVCGVDAMHYTNIEMDPSQVEPGLIQFDRILPCLNASARDFQALVQVGINRAVVKDVSPDNIWKLQLLSEIWPKMAAKQKYSEQGVSKSSARRRRRASSSPPTSPRGEWYTCCVSFNCLDASEGPLGALKYQVTL
jgi:hypothetical protein